MNRFLAALALLLLAATGAAAQTNVVWGLATGANPRNLCVYDSTHACVTTGTLDSTLRVFTPSVPNGTITGGMLAAGAAAANLGFTPLNPANNLSDLTSATTARTNLGLGTAAVANTGTSGATLCLLNGTCTFATMPTFTAGQLPPASGGTGLSTFTRSGNTTDFATATGTLTPGHCVSIDSNGNFIDAGGACTTGGGGGTVTAGTVGQLAYYSGATNTGSFALAGDCTFAYPNITCLKSNGVTLGALATLTPGTGVSTALAAPLNAASGLVGYSGALGTPASGTLTHATGLPISTGVSGLGAGVATALGNTAGAAGGFATYNQLGSLATITPGTGVATALATPLNAAGGVAGYSLIAPQAGYSASAGLGSAANYNTAQTNAALAALPSTVGPVQRNGVYAAGDAPPLVFVSSGAACTRNAGAGDVGTQVPTSDGKCWTSNASQINVLQFGAYPNFTNQAATTTAFQNWWVACMAAVPNSYGGAGGHDCAMPAGHYNIASTLIWDFATNVGGGAFVHGAGPNATLLDFSATPNQYLLIENTLGTGYFYPHFADFGVSAANVTNGDLAAFQVDPPPVTLTTTAGWTTGANAISVANCNRFGVYQQVSVPVIDVTLVPAQVIGNAVSCVGTTLTFAANAAYAGSSGDSLIMNNQNAMNGGMFTGIWAVNSTGCAAGTTSISINNFYNGYSNNITTNLGGCSSNSSGAGTNPTGGDSVRLTGVGFSTFHGSFSGATCGLRLSANQAAYTYSNTFLTLDAEVTYNAICIDSQYVLNNTFIGGQYVWCNASSSCPSGTGYAVNVTATAIPNGNVFDNPNFGLGGVLVGGTYGPWTSIRLPGSPVATPVVPASGTVIQNTTNRRVLVTAESAATTLYCFGPAGAMACLGLATNNIAFSYVLNPGDSTKLIYTGTPGWVWQPTE